MRDTKFKPLRKRFYRNSPEEVAEKLLGKLLIRKTGRDTLIGRVVETEAYFGKNDPASRAAVSRKWEEKMLREPGKTFIYCVHNNWMLNIIAHPAGEAGAVLIRAVEPLKGADFMMKMRGVKKCENLTSGPGKLTRAMKIDRALDNVPVYTEKSPLMICSDALKTDFETGRTFRVGVKRDLSKPMRFYIKGNRFVSRK